ncbi:MAG: flagellar motor switch protein FliN [Methylomonas sp.]|nr:flagellar motor switch protein FliN [Methylomonas sp.]
MSENDELGDDWAAAMNEQSADDADWGAAMAEQAQDGKSAAAYAPAEFPEFADAKPQKTDRTDEVKLDVILDVPVTMSLEIGRTRINIRNLLQLNQGSVVELDRFAGEPMDVLVNGTLVAHGEVVVVNDKFGIRLTDIISPSERVRKLG